MEDTLSVTHIDRLYLSLPFQCAQVLNAYTHILLLITGNAKYSSHSVIYIMLTNLSQDSTHILTNFLNWTNTFSLQMTFLYKESTEVAPFSIQRSGQHMLHCCIICHFLFLLWSVHVDDCEELDSIPPWEQRNAWSRILPSLPRRRSADAGVRVPTAAHEGEGSRDTAATAETDRRRQAILRGRE
jgi:hypothetical protein